MAVPTITRQQALAWRLRCQHLVAGAASPVEVVRTLAAVSVNGSDPDLAVRRRLADRARPARCTVRSPEHRTSMTRGTSPVVVDGVVRGTWRLVSGAVEVDAPDPPADATAAEVERVEGLLRTP